MDGEKNLEDFSKSSTSKNPYFGSHNAAEKSFFDLTVHQNENVVQTINKTTNRNLYYDPQAMRPKSIICSEVISKTRLSARDANLENSVVKSPVESDEAFFEKLRKRINEDREKLDTSKSVTILPKRGSIVRKRRNLFNNESLNLMKKFRQEILSRTDRLSEDPAGIFSMSSTSNGNEENFHAANSSKQTSQNSSSNKKHESVMAEMAINENSFSTDQDSLCQTPFQMNKSIENLNRSPPSPSTPILPWDRV